MDTNGWSIQHESKDWRFESPSGQVFFLSQKLKKKMNAVASAQLTFQMLPLQLKNTEEK